MQTIRRTKYDIKLYALAPGADGNACLRTPTASQLGDPAGYVQTVMLARPEQAKAKPSHRHAHKHLDKATRA